MKDRKKIRIKKNKQKDKKKWLINQFQEEFDGMKCKIDVNEKLEF